MKVKLVEYLKEKLGKKINPATVNTILRQQLSIPDGPIDVTLIEKIANYLGVTFALYKKVEHDEGEGLELICENDLDSDQHVNILLLDQHYWKILSDVRPLVKKSVTFQ